MDIYLLRHGETDWNKKKRLQGHTNTALNEKGRRQVEDTARKLAALGIRMDAVVTSPLKRAKESAAIAARVLGFPQEKIVVEDLLIERCFGEGEGMTVDEFAAKYETDISAPPCQGLESQRELIERSGRAFQKITDAFCDAGQILLAAHGAVLFALLEAVSEETIPCSGRAACITQGSIYRIRHENGKNRIAAYEDETKAFVELDAAAIGRTAKIYL